MEGIEFLRCVFDGHSSYHMSGVGDCNGHLIVRNCMFLTTGGKVHSGAMSEATFENCIFIGGNFTDVANCVFNHSSAIWEACLEETRIYVHGNSQGL